MVKLHHGDSTHMEKCRTVKFKIGKLHVNFNPVVTICSAIIIWGLVIYCLVETETAAVEMPKWTTWVTKNWTWLYIGTQDAWAVFMIVLFFSKYSKLKLGKTDDEKPEFSDATYFSMLFAAGIGVGLFYFGVAESMSHYEPGGQFGNRYQGRYSDNQRAQDAINLTIFHWGVHGWIVYTMIGLLLGFLCYRKDMPMSMRTCFYPLLGDKIYGTFGDVVDILSVVCTMFGVCTSLGAGAIQLNDGLNRLNPNIEKSRISQVIIIWGITAVATASVISGLKIGIRRLSEICFSLGMFIFFVVFYFDDTWFLLNVFVQSIGYYLQWLVQLGFHTDAFAQLGIAPDKKEAPGWMNDWTIFYWGWWIAWAPFVGVFIARISRGRTIRQFITYTLTVPIIYCIMWFSIFGALGIKMERQAALAGIQCNSTLGGATSTKSLNGLFRLSCRPSTSMWFDVMDQYGGIGPFLSGISIVGLILYFVTSSDSGSLVIDSLSANGHPDPPVLQRVFWALTEGACATGLLWTGGNRALSALQAASVSSGLLYTVILNFVCVATWRAVKHDTGDLDFDGPQFTMGLFDFFYEPSLSRIKRLGIAIVAPWWPMGNAAAKVDPKSRRWVAMVFLAVPFYAWLLLTALQPLEIGLAYIGWSILMGFFAFGAGIRFQIRDKYGIIGNMAEDFFALMLLYPFAAMQMEEHMMYSRDVPDKDVELQSLDTMVMSRSGTYNTGFDRYTNGQRDSVGIKMAEAEEKLIANGMWKSGMPDRYYEPPGLGYKERDVDSVGEKKFGNGRDWKNGLPDYEQAKMGYDYRNGRNMNEDDNRNGRLGNDGAPDRHHERPGMEYSPRNENGVADENRRRRASGGTPERYGDHSRNGHSPRKGNGAVAEVENRNGRMGNAGMADRFDDHHGMSHYDIEVPGNDLYNRNGRHGRERAEQESDSPLDVPETHRRSPPGRGNYPVTEYL